MEKLIYQDDENGCGLAALRMLLVALTGHASYRYFALAGHPPYSLETLRLGAAKEGTELLFKKVSDLNAIRQNKKWPLLLLMKSGANGHLVMVTRRCGQWLRVYDPSEGKSWMSVSALQKRWTGIFGEGRIREKRRCPYHKISLFPKVGLLFPSLFAIVSCLLLFSGFYFLKEDSNYLAPILCFAFYGLAEIGERFSMVRAMKAFDRRWLPAIYDSEPERFRKNFEHYFSFKKNAFPVWLDFFEGAASALGLLILVGFNEPSFFAAAGGIALYQLIVSLTLSRGMRHRKIALGQAETSLFRGSHSREEETISLKEINAEAYRIGDLLSYERIVFIAVSLVLALFPVLASQEITLNYFLFHFFALSAVGEGLRKAMSFFEGKPEREIEEAYFQEYLGKNHARK